MEIRGDSGLPLSPSLLSPTDVSWNKYLRLANEVQNRFIRVGKQYEDLPSNFYSDYLMVLNLISEDKVDNYDLIRAYDMSTDELAALYGKTPKGKNSTPKVNSYDLARYAQLKRDMRFKLSYKLSECKAKGYYPLFQTLTLASLEDLEHKYTKGWESYIKRLERFVGKENLIYYYCVPEKGPQGQRDHLHVLLILKDMPDHCFIDPNVGQVRAKGTYEVIAFNHLWKYGRNNTIAARFGKHDIWSTKHSWATCEHVEKNFSFERLVNYLVKELSKQIGGNKLCQYRIRTTRNSLSDLENSLAQLLESIQTQVDIHQFPHLINQWLKNPVSPILIKKLTINGIRKMPKYQSILNPPDMAKTWNSLQMNSGQDSLKILESVQEIPLKTKLNIPEEVLNVSLSDPGYNLSLVFSLIHQFRAERLETQLKINQAHLETFGPEILNHFEDWQREELFNFSPSCYI